MSRNRQGDASISLDTAEQFLEGHAEAIGNLGCRAQRQVFLSRLYLAHIGFRHMGHIGQLPLGNTLGHTNIADAAANFALNILHGLTVTPRAQHRSVIYELMKNDDK